MKSNNEQFFSVLANEAKNLKVDLFAPLAQTMEGQASYFGSLTRKTADFLYPKAKTQAANALYLLNVLKDAGFAKPAGDEVQTLQDAVTIKVYNFLWAIALVGKCENSEAFANRLLGRQVTQKQAIQKLGGAESFIVANFKATEQRQIALEAIRNLRKVAEIELPEKVNKGYSSDMRNAAKLIKGKQLNGKPTKREAQTPEQELASLNEAKQS